MVEMVEYSKMEVGDVGTFLHTAYETYKDARKQLKMYRRLHAALVAAETKDSQALAQAERNLDSALEEERKARRIYLDAKESVYKEYNRLCHEHGSRPLTETKGIPPPERERVFSYKLGYVELMKSSHEGRKDFLTKLDISSKQEALLIKDGLLQTHDDGGLFDQTQASMKEWPNNAKAITDEKNKMLDGVLKFPEECLPSGRHANRKQKTEATAFQSVRGFEPEEKPTALESLLQPKPEMTPAHFEKLKKAFKAKQNRHEQKCLSCVPQEPKPNTKLREFLQGFTQTGVPSVRRLPATTGNGGAQRGEFPPEFVPLERRLVQPATTGKGGGRKRRFAVLGDSEDDDRPDGTRVKPIQVSDSEADCCPDGTCVENKKPIEPLKRNLLNRWFKQKAASDTVAQEVADAAVLPGRKRKRAQYAVDILPKQKKRRVQDAFKFMQDGHENASHYAAKLHKLFSPENTEYGWLEAQIAYNACDEGDEVLKECMMNLWLQAIHEAFLNKFCFPLLSR